MAIKHLRRILENVVVPQIVSDWNKNKKNLLQPTRTRLEPYRLLFRSMNTSESFSRHVWRTTLSRYGFCLNAAQIRAEMFSTAEGSRMTDPSSRTGSVLREEDSKTLAEGEDFLLWAPGEERYDRRRRFLNVLEPSRRTKCLFWMWIPE